MLKRYHVNMITLFQENVLSWYAGLDRDREHILSVLWPILKRQRRLPIMPQHWTTQINNRNDDEVNRTEIEQIMIGQTVMREGC
jgi:hypothetical protein